jgi:PST family polysaccharide transporter
VVLVIGVAACAPWLAAFYGDELLVPLTWFIAPSFLLASLRVVQAAVMTRDMRFREIGIVEIAATLAGGAVGIAMALAGSGVWSLVTLLLTTAAVEVAGLWWSSGWRPRFAFDSAALRELLPYSANFMGFTVINYWARNLDSLLIGRFVGPAGLGLYDRAYRTMLVPLTHASSVMSRVMFPALSRLQDERDAVKTLYLRAIRAISLVTFPITVGLFVTADVFVLTLFGPRWVAIIPVLRVLCLVGLLQSVSSSTGWLYQSQGRTDVMFRWALFSGAVTLVAFSVGIRWGVMGVALAYVIRTTALTPLSFMIPGRFVGIRLRDVVGALGGTLACALGMGAIVALLGRALAHDTPVAASLALQSTFGIACYAAIAHFAGLAAYRDTLQTVRNYWSSLTAR